MTAEQEKQFGEMHDAIIRMDATVHKDLKDIKGTLYGNGKIGLKVEVPLIRQEVESLNQKHASCEAEKRRLKDLEPTKSSNKIAIIALLAAIASPFVAKWLG